ncbi:hypothetical protein AQJ84_09240 [Streptomyces resistomycificus]|uniref:Uncharacterized protein n=1 Tax=Streptomyces resistomycificus TaxID=67356 RepID=A0A0L8LZU6_9ACTN|nr:hypothetical protein ADK37_00875 [Streptomyces resistomycificus]KUN99859.1 hypothetical protein AQJ84_09240 [Streptomyces resistomycificus]
MVVLDEGEVPMVDAADLFDAGERLDGAGLRALQLERLRASLRHAYEHVPFYRESFDKAGVHPDGCRRHTCGQSLRPFDGRDLADSITRDCCRFVAYPTRTDWRIRRASEDTPGALLVTWMYAQDSHTQDIADPVHNPACGRPSRGLDYDPQTCHRVHLCPSPACRHQWPADDFPTPSDHAATEHDQRPALATR